MPAAWTTAVMTFQTSRDGSTFLEVQDGAGNALTLTVAASQYILIDPARFRGTNLLKVRSGTAAAPVNQPAQAVIGLVVRPIV